MAWLFLDTHLAGHVRFGWVGGTIRTRSGRAARVLPALEKELPAIRRADGICVVAGPGSFSSVRTGVLYANLLARLLHLPLVGVSARDASDLKALEHRLKSVIRHPPSGDLRRSRYVAPVYDAEPNITLPARA